MANATKDLSITRAGKEGRTIHLPMGDAVSVFKGIMVQEDAGDNGIQRINVGGPGSKAVGVTLHAADNTAGGAATGDVRVEVETDRVFVFNNSGSDPVTEANTALGADVFAEDDNTIGATDQTASLAKAGVFYGLEDDGRVRVYIGPQT